MVWGFRRWVIVAISRKNHPERVRMVPGCALRFNELAPRAEICDAVALLAADMASDDVEASNQAKRGGECAVVTVTVIGQLRPKGLRVATSIHGAGRELPS